MTGSTTTARAGVGLALGAAGVLASGVPAVVAGSRWTIVLGMAGTAVLLLLARASVRSPRLAAVHPALLVFAAISVLAWLSGVLTTLPPIAGALASAPVPLAFLVVNGVKLVPVALVALLARAHRWTPDELYLRVGAPGASGWPILGPASCLLVPILFLTGLPGGALSRLPAVLAWLPVMLVACLINAAAEEFLYRSAALRALRGVLAVRPAVLLTSATFGLSHLGGNPGGWLGVAAATLFGLACALAMIQTRGWCWNLAIHVCADLGIVLSLSLVS